MSKNVVTVAPGDPVSKVAEKLYKNGFHGLPVVENKKIVGIITEDDFYIKNNYSLFLPSYINFLQDAKAINDLPEEESIKIKKILNAKASDIMSDHCVTVKEDMLVIDLLSLIKKTKFNTLPVASGDNELIGIVTLIDILGMVSGGANDIFQLSRVSRGSFREIDSVASEALSFWKKTYVLMVKKNIRTWKAIFIFAFLAGTVAAVIWNISIRIETATK
ncbi:MAG TPA: CBS domain-containing protein [Patescibacteria group bacterium]|nr:CBS domain-containing protein [Patescibacteria group bacterium]